MKPRVRVRGMRRVVAIGDLHDNPEREKERFKWISRYIADVQPDNVVQIGDWISLDSLSAHDKPGSRKFYERPVFLEDMASLNETLDIFHSEFDARKIPCFITMGNHEHRAVRVEENTPNLQDAVYQPILSAFHSRGWEVLDYGDWLFLEGVGFTHIPINGMGKDYRGKTVENQIANDAMFSIVFGHTHKTAVRTVPKIGPGKCISLVNLGTALPQGEIEHYAGISTTGWSYGVYLLTLSAGVVVSHHYTSMVELEERYS